MRRRPRGRRRTQARPIAGVPNGGWGESREENGREKRGRIFIVAQTKPGVCFLRALRGSSFCFFWFFFSNQRRASTYCLSLAVCHRRSLFFLPPCRRLSYCLPAGQRGGWASVVWARHWLHLLNTKCQVVPPALLWGQGRILLFAQYTTNFLNSADYKQTNIIYVDLIDFNITRDSKSHNSKVSRISAYLTRVWPSEPRCPDTNRHGIGFSGGGRTHFVSFIAFWLPALWWRQRCHLMA